MYNSKLLYLLAISLFGVPIATAQVVHKSSRTESQISFLRVAIQRGVERNPDADFCADDDQNILTESHAPGNCPTFDGYLCLCELNANCEYNKEDEKCREVSDCIHHTNPSECRAAHCYFDCGTRRCVTKQDVHEFCGGECSHYCHDLCQCQSHNCQYTAQGACQEFKKPDCPTTFINSPYCGRQGSHYLRRGAFCINTHPGGNCELDKTIAAVNFGGGPATDSHGIWHKAEVELPPRDEHGIKLHQSINKEDLVTDKDDAFYKNIIYGDPEKNGPDRCIEYTIPMEDGVYELVVKTVEAFDSQAGEKQFNVKFGDQYIFPEVDVMKLTGKRYQPLELITNFKVTGNLLIVQDVMEYQIQNNVVPLAFCYSQCAGSENYFQVAAFSISKFKTGDNGDPVDCSKFHDDPWSCRSAGCNHTGSECIPPLVTDPGPIPDCTDLNVDVVFLLDRTSSYPESGGAKSLVLDEFPRVLEIVDGIRKKFAKTKVGVALFSEFGCQDANLCDDGPGGGNKNHDLINGCYHRHLPLMHDLSVIKTLSRRPFFKIAFSAHSEPGLFATMMAVEDCAMNWTRSGYPAIKVIILMTDDKAHGYDTQVDFLKVKRPPKMDGLDTCWGALIPSRSQLNEYLRRERVSLYLLVGKQEHATSYQNLLDSTAVDTAVGFIESETSVIGKDVEEFIQKQLTKQAETGGCHTEVKCPPIELEMLFLLDSTSDYTWNGNPADKQRSLVFDEFQRIVKITDNLQQSFPHSKFGAALFSEYSCRDHGESCRVATHAIYNGCYRTVQKLLRDVTLLQENTRRDKLKIYPSVYFEPGFFGAMLALQKFDIDWTPGNPPTVNKVIVLITNDGVHFETGNAFHNKTAPKLDGTDDCHKTVQLSKEGYNNYFHREGASFFILADTSTNIASYANNLDRRLVAVASEDMRASNDRIEDAMTKFITDINEKKSKALLDQGVCVKGRS